MYVQIDNMICIHVCTYTFIHADRWLGTYMDEKKNRDRESLRGVGLSDGLKCCLNQRL
jgi:hypothetical protein